jgi:hypothetical protein
MRLTPFQVRLASFLSRLKQRSSHVSSSRTGYLPLEEQELLPVVSRMGEFHISKRTWKGVKLVGPVAMLIDEYSLQQEEVFDSSPALGSSASAIALGNRHLLDLSDRR